MPVRVLHVTQPTSAGVAQVVSQLVDDQVARGWDVRIAAPDNGWLPAWAQANGVPLEVWTARRSPGLFTVAEVTGLHSIARRYKPDLVHLHSAKAGLAGRLALHGSVPTVYQPHAWSFHATQGAIRSLAAHWERSGARWTSLLIAVSEQELREGAAVGVAGRCSVVPNGVDLDRFQPSDRRDAQDALGIPTGPTVVCIGRLTRQKGQDVLLQAWAGVRKVIDDARLYLVGDGPDMSKLVATNQEGATLVGHSNDTPHWLAAADVVAMPSRWEGGSLVLLEAMASARSVVATAVAGVEDYLPESAGAVVAVNDPQALAEAIIERLADPDLRDLEGVAGLNAARERHDRRTTAAQVASLYQELIDATIR